MKLHLPCRLRAAVMALFATAVISAPAYAADPVTWDKTNEIIVAVGAPQTGALPFMGGFAGKGAYAYGALKDIDLKGTNWTMTVNGTGFNMPPHSDPEAFKWPSTLISYAGGQADHPNGFFNTYDDPTGALLTEGFVLGFGYGSKSSAKTLYFGYGGEGDGNAAWISLGKVDDYLDTDITYTVDISYTDGKFSLNSVIINGKSITLPNTVKDLAITIPDNSKMFNADTWNPSTLTSITATGGSSEITLISPIGDYAWQVTGSATLNSWSEGTAINDGNVHFVGNNGIMKQDQAAVVRIENKLTAGLDINDLKSGFSFGFDVVAGGTLDIKDGCSTDSGVLTGISKGAGLRLYGEGEVKLNCEAENTLSENMGAITHSGTGTLHINNGDFSVYLGDITAANATIKATGEGILHIANTKSVNIKELIANSVTIANGGTVSNINTHQLTIEAGKFQAGNQDLNLNTYGDMLTVGADATMIVTKNISLTNANIDGVLDSRNGITSASNGQVNVSGTLLVNNLDSIGGGVAVTGGTIQAAGGYIEAGKLEITNGSVTADTIKTADFGGYSTLSVSGDSNVAVKKSVTAYNVITDAVSLTPTAGMTTLTNGATITGNSIVAGAIDNADIVITAPTTLSRITAPAGTILATDTLTNADLTINGSKVISAISEATSIVVNGQKTTANTIEANMVDTAGGHTIVANSIKAAAILPNKHSYASQNAEMTGIRTLNNKLVDANTIKADYVGFDNVEVKNATVTGGALELLNATKLTNVNLKNSTITKHNGNVTLNEVKLGKNQNFADTFTAVSSPEVVLRGSTTPTSLKLDFLTINDAEGDMVFPNSPKDEYTRYTIMKMGDKTALDYAGIAEGERITSPEVVLMNISSYTRSYVIIEGDEVVIYGMEDKEGIISELSQTDNQRTVMNVLSETANSGEISGDMKEIYDYVGNINLYTTEERQKMVSAASAASVTALASSQRDGIYDSQKNLRNRIIQMGGITHGPEDNMQYVGLQAWVQADTGFHSIGATEDSAGYDYNTHGGTVGFNLNLAENLIVGAAFSASYGNLDAQAMDKGEGTNDAYYLNLFARYQSNRWTHLFLFTAGFNDMEMERSVTGMNYAGTQNVVDKKATGSTDGYSLSAYYEAGYIFSLNEESTQILQPIFSLNLTSAHVNGYKEKGSIGNAGLEYEGVDSFYGQVGIGARYQAVIHTTEYERNAVLELRAQVVQNFGDATDEADVAFLGGGRTFTTKGTEVGTTGFQLGAGVSLPLGNQTTLFVDADADFRSEATSVHANLGLRYDF